ncbi:MAG: hypothetical protein ACPGVU_25535 [Limisphaerales bacterium]
MRAWIAGLACGWYPFLIDLGCKLCWDGPYTVAVLGAAMMLMGREPRRPGLAGLLAALSWWILNRLAPLWVVAVATLLLHVMLFSKTRYRVPVIPPLIVFAALAIPARRRGVLGAR